MTENGSLVDGVTGPDQPHSAPLSGSETAHLWPPAWPEIQDEAVRQAMLRVPREAFVPEAYRHLAYADRPLPIGYEQTISQPFIVALMTQSLRLQRSDCVLEVGTGCGYQSAVLAELCRQVHTVEVVPALAAQAEQRLHDLGYSNVAVHVGDGYAGWPPAAPYQAILVTAAPPDIPSPLIEQLDQGGRMVIPVGPQHADQILYLLDKHKGRVRRRTITIVRFVPLVHGWQD